MRRTSTRSIVAGLLLLAASSSSGAPAPGPVERTLRELAAVAAAEGSQAAVEQSRARGLRARAGRVAVRAILEPGVQPRDISAASLRAVGARVLLRSRSLLDLEVPFARLLDLPAAVDGLAGLARILPATRTSLSQGVAVTGASVLHGAGVDGSGLVAAVFDTGFTGTSSVAAAGELGSYLTVDFSGYGFESGASPHGVACAEIVHDMAPGAFLYLVNLYDSASFELAVDWAISNGVDVISMSLAFLGDSFGDGTGIVGEQAQRAIDAGIVFVSAAGNYAESHWDGPWSDVDNDGWLEWDPWTADESQSMWLPAGWPMDLTLTWDDFPTSCSDYDLYVYDEWGSEVAYSENEQSCGPGAVPVEWVSFTTGSTGWYDVQVFRRSGATFESLDLVATSGFFEHNVAEHSVIDPAARADVVAVAAMDQASWTTGPQDSYSSQGPTHGGLLKPDITGPTYVDTAAYGPGVFNGTSAATPHVAGAMLLMLDQPATSGDPVAALFDAAIDMGDPGQDPIFGRGRMLVPRVFGPVGDDDDTSPDDDDTSPDDDDTAPDDDDTVPDDDDTTPDDDDASPDDDDAIPDDDDTTPDDDDTTPDDDDTTPDDDDASPDDDDASPDDDDASPPPPDDALENDDAAAQATDVGCSYSSERLIQNDEDWFVVEAAASGTLVAAASYDADDGWIGLSVLSAATGQEVRSAEGDGFELAAFEGAAPGRYYVRIDGAVNAGVGYRLRLDAPCVPAPSPPPDDGRTEAGCRAATAGDGGALLAPILLLLFGLRRRRAIVPTGPRGRGALPLLLALLTGCGAGGSLPGVIDDDGDGWPVEDDCDDSDASVHPGAVEVPYDGVDQDCDGADRTDWDGDGVAGGPSGLDCDDLDPSRNPDAVEVPYDGIDQDCDGGDLTDVDGDGHDGPSETGPDCDDGDAGVYPGADEVCDGRDDDCDGAIDELPDLDGDGVGPCAGDCDDDDPTRAPTRPELCDGLDNDCDGVVPQAELDGDGDGFAPCAGDCDDDNAQRFPGATEDCDGVDQNCNGTIDDSPDGDGDGVGICLDCDDDNPAVRPGRNESCDGLDTNCDGLIPGDESDADGDLFRPCGGDCDDGVATIHPGAPEVCDGVDDDCDGVVDDVGDADGDGVSACGDCDDGDATAFPGGPELCDGIDNDCDGAVPVDELDGDGDGYAPCAGDCDDGRPDVSPGAVEQCNGEDDDCDGAPLATEVDGDGDGYLACADCDDGDPAISPAATEVCDGVDDDCDGVLPVDELDADGDGQRPCDGDCDDGDAARFLGNPEVCDGRDNDCDGATPADEADGDGDGARPCGGDCDDTNPSVYPGAPELCDGLDNDCDGSIDEPDDVDGDGFGRCAGGDCDDTNPSVYPGAPELCDGLDNDCNGAIEVDPDADGDGFTPCGGDCDDQDPALHPGATEVCDGLDTNCDGVVAGGELDQDGDSWLPCTGDCDDLDASRYPGAPELCDGLDTDCDGVIPAVEVDGDGDGARVCDGDCDDGDAAVGPWAPERCNGADDNCDGAPGADEIDQDLDGHLACADCDDLAGAVHPGAPELCDGLDDNCDGAVPDDESDADGDGLRICAGDCDDENAAVLPGHPEDCDGLDNDCDGAPGPGEEDDDVDGWLPCEGDCADNDPRRFPGAAEVCDGLDNDCDPATDEAADVDGDGASVCDGDCQDDDPATVPVPPNHPPVAEAGPIVSVSDSVLCTSGPYNATCSPCQGAWVDLDGSLTQDPDGDLLLALWSGIVSGGTGALTLSDRTSLNAGATLDGDTPPAGGSVITSFVFTLAVTDCAGASDSDTVIVQLICEGIE